MMKPYFQDISWLKLWGQNWPVKIKSKSSNEIRTGVVFDDNDSELHVAQHNLKPFTKLNKVPKKSKEWLRGYNRALTLYKSDMICISRPIQ